MNLPDALLEEVKQHAAASGRTVTSVVEEALRSMLIRHQQEQRRPVLPLRSFGAPGDRLLVDLEDKDALWAILDAEE